MPPKIKGTISLLIRHANSNGLELYAKHGIINLKGPFSSTVRGGGSGSVKVVRTRPNRPPIPARENFAIKITLRGKGLRIQ